MIENKELSKIAGYELSALKESEQQIIYDLLTELQRKISTKEAEQIKELSKSNNLTSESARVVLTDSDEEEPGKEQKPKEKKISISIPKSFENYFPTTCDSKEKRENVILWLLETYQEEIAERFSEDEDKE